MLITNGDNYYVPRFVEFVFDAADRDDFDMILWNLVHSYSSPGQKTLRCYTPFHVHPFLYMVDTAAAMVKTPIAQQVGFRERSHDADAKYIEAILSLPRASLRIGKLEKTLAVHN